MREIKCRINRACLAIFFFILFAGTLQVFQQLLVGTISELSLKAVNVANNISFGFSYLISYLISILLYRAIFKKEYISPSFSMKLGDFPGAFIISSLGLCFTASHLMRYFSDGGPGVTTSYHDENIVLMVFTTVLIPALCEELFFRGLIMTNLMPLGKNFAIIVSGIIFGLVHGNHDQIFFATISGIVFGWLYTETGSIWCGVIVHMLNNLIAVTETVLVGTLKNSTALKLCAVIESTVLICGAISLIYLVPKLKKRQKSEFRDGAFGIITKRLMDFGKHYSLREYVLGFFSPLMIVFLIYVVFSEIVYVGLLG